MKLTYIIPNCTLRYFGTLCFSVGRQHGGNDDDYEWMRREAEFNYCFLVGRQGHDYS